MGIKVLKFIKFLTLALIKFLISIHFLIFISFLFLHFLPGSFVEDEFIIVNTNPREKVFFFELKNYLSRIYSLDLGYSYQSPQTSVWEVISERYQNSLNLIIYSFFMILLGAFLVAFIALQNNRLEKLFKGLFTILNTIPLIVILPILIFISYHILKIIPSRYDSENSVSIFFAMLLMTIKPLFHLAEMIFHRWQQEEKNYYIIFAKAKGLSILAIRLKHSLKNILPSIINYSQSIFLSLISGNFLVESFYSIPGVGLTFVEAMSNRDLPLIMGTVLVFGGVFYLVNSLSEVLIGYLNLSSGSTNEVF